jgi:hypothetical protein
VFTYRLHLKDGSDVGEGSYPSMVKVGEELFFGGGRKFRVLDVVPFEEEDDSRYVGLLQVKVASASTALALPAVVRTRPRLSA